MTTPNYVILVLNEYDGAGNQIVSGTATLTPSTALVDVIDQMDITPWAPLATFRAASFPMVRLLATDNANVAPMGWTWTLSFSGVAGNPAARSFFLPFSAGSTQYLSNLTAVPRSVPATITNLDGGSAVTGAFPAGTIDGGSA